MLVNNGKELSESAGDVSNLKFESLSRTQSRTRTQ